VNIAPPPHDLEIALDASVSFFLQPDRLLLALRNGDLCVCTTTGRDTVTDTDIGAKAPASPGACV
jgi:hypothetical protein